MRAECVAAALTGTVAAEPHSESLAPKADAAYGTIERPSRLTLLGPRSAGSSLHCDRDNEAQAIDFQLRDLRADCLRQHHSENLAVEISACLG
jgi:hypothetical protein